MASPDRSQQSGAVFGEMAKIVGDAVKRIRILEERQENLEARMNSLESRFSEELSKIQSQIETVNHRLQELSGRLANMEVDIKRHEGQMAKLVTKKELIEIKEYIDLFGPLTTKFATKSEVEKMIEEKMSSIWGKK